MRRILEFSNTIILAELIEDADKHQISDEAIVINLGVTPIVIPDVSEQLLPPFQSSILRNVELHDVAGAAVIRVENEFSCAGLSAVLQWDRLSSLIETPSVEIMELQLFRSKQDFIGPRILEGHILGLVSDGDNLPRSYDVGLNLWYAPGNTDCLIHRLHPFMETHVQIAGQGRMQKFRQDAHSTLYQDIPMLPGVAQPFFQCAKGDDGSFVYPWHQYRADTDCIWMAIEFHPSGSSA